MRGREARVPSGRRGGHGQRIRHASILTESDVCGNFCVRDIDESMSDPEVLMPSRLQLALNVNDIDQAVTFYCGCSAPSPPSGGPATRTSPSPSRRSSSSCWRTPARAAASTTSASRSPTATPSRPSRPAWPRPGWPRSRSATPPAATPSRTSSGSRARPTASAGRSTPSWRTARPSGAEGRPGVLRRDRRSRRPGRQCWLSLLLASTRPGRAALGATRPPAAARLARGR